MCPAPRDQMVRLGHLSVRVRVTGDPSTRPLLLLNGIGAPIELWDPLIARLPDVHTISFDAPGSGSSEAPAIPLSIGDHARVGLSLLDHLAVPEADVLGLSFGGMVAQELAHLAPARVRHLVLASTSCGWGAVPGTPAALLAISTPDRYYSRAMFEAVAPQYIGGREGHDQAFLRKQATSRQRHPPSTRGYMYQFLAAAAWSSLLWLSDVRQPTLVLTGEHDPLIPPTNSAILASLLPNATKYVVRGGGHLCLLERASLLAPMIQRFVESGSAGRVRPAARRAASAGA